MIPDRQTILREAIDLINRSGTGLLLTNPHHQGQRLWIGTPVSTEDGRTLRSFLDPSSPLCARVACSPEVVWRFHDESGSFHLLIEGTAQIIPGPTWERIQRARALIPGGASLGGARLRPSPPAEPSRGARPAWTDSRPFAALVTTVRSVVHAVPAEKMSCRVILPPIPSDRPRDRAVDGTAWQPCLAF